MRTLRIKQCKSNEIAGKQFICLPKYILVITETVVCGATVMSRGKIVFGLVPTVEHVSFNPFIPAGVCWSYCLFSFLQKKTCRCFSCLTVWESASPQFEIIHHRKQDNFIWVCQTFCFIIVYCNFARVERYEAFRLSLFTVNLTQGSDRMKGNLFKTMLLYHLSLLLSDTSLFTRMMFILSSLYLKTFLISCVTVTSSPLPKKAFLST